MACCLCNDCLHYDCESCEGLLCDNVLGCECCLVYRRGYPCSCYLSIEDGAVGLLEESNKQEE